MTDTELEILSTLRELDEKVRGMASANPKPNLLPLFERLDSLSAKLAGKGDPSLLHYLHRKSYEKARLYLEERHADNAARTPGA